ncbi:D-amino acid dehydrogenase [Acetobacter orleanensis]|uniref:D-amino acid dehydrogenase n=1 Tax=Acetobacter orleanensis TaxID=104099 RepID=A0A4Y3TQC8_9PROT|nr:D-amino acid dehydrogenase [Acetobacter orleanensis]KXV62698.1 amino acid dehydrogenase [Acetobacter orleanensis]PCD79215.1 D-amino acid dehydrogenase small subunit [Acetobacter orleanensis]GAN68589.1 D-amino acid dehydrogenase small subunit [Acetobacter orleanensis JCM 7639]GBR27645.1 D-amino acid dehydrogenase small subunit [Acetobacter orleanensis NRIC 0473]GEB83220.1 D-amino acid dehydrogenase [Acetobacter orleanensis]
MKVIVLGGGVVGVTSAWYLAQAGHEVTVVERQPESGMETSFANAGQVSPGYSAPWAGPGVPLKSIKWLMMAYRPFVFWPMPDPHLWTWLVQMLENCTSAAYDRNKGRMVRLAEYSRDVMMDLRANTGIKYDDRQQGTLQVFRTQKQLDGAAQDIAVLKQYQVPYEVLDRAGCVQAEPGLGETANKIVGGLRLPGDETGDAFKFTQRLAAMAEEAGVTFMYNTRIKQLLSEGGRITGVDTNKGVLSAESYVLSLGSFSPALVRSLGIKLPIYPVKGYSLTADITNADHAPVSTVMDETFKIGITRLGDRVRVGGTAELAGFSRRLRAPRRATLEHSVTDLFPDCCDVPGASFWTGLRPMTPDGTPVIGRTGFENLFLNTGHGTLGWTMACGSGRVLADIMSDKKPDIAYEDLNIFRYSHS